MRLSRSLLAFLLLSLSGCSSFIQKTAVRTTGDLLAVSSNEMKSEMSWEFFRDSTPANLKMAEGLLFVDPENANILLTLTKGFGGLGFGVYETQSLVENYGEKEMRPATNQTIYAYSKGVRYGLRWLASQGIVVKTLLKSSNEAGKVHQILDNELDSTDQKNLEGVFFTAQSWAGLINLSKTEPELLSQFPLVKQLFDWVCSASPKFEHGACDVFYGAYYASRPKMLGGDIQKGLTHFQKAIAQNPDNLLPRVSLLQFYAIPFEEEEVYREHSKIIKDYQKKFEEMSTFSVNRPESKLTGTTNLFNAIAIERFKIMQKFEKEFF